MRTKLCAAALFLSLASTQVSAHVNDNITVCATTQMYHSLEAIKAKSNIAFDAYYATPSELYAMISNNSKKCDILISSEEKVAIELIRSNKANAQSMQAFLRAPLILWSKNPYLFNRNSTKAITDKELQSIALARPELTPVGFATSQVVSSEKFPTKYLQDNTYRADHEYQVYSMVDSENVQAGFITKPLVTGVTRKMNGSYWVVPKSYHADILYYITIMQDSTKNKDVISLYNYLKQDKKVMELYQIFGFEDINSSKNKAEKEL